MPDYLPENGDPQWWGYGPWPPPMHQPFRSVLTPDQSILLEAAQVYALTGLQPADTRGLLLSQMDELTQLVTGFRFQTALRRLRERP